MNVGVAEIDITPDFSVELSGFASRLHASVGVLEPIHARALYLHDEQTGEKLLWIACDVIALRGQFVEEFRAWAKDVRGLEGRQVLLCATHTHTAPATINLNGAGRFSAKYEELLRQKLQDVAQRATAQSEQCRVVCASAALELAIHRRGPASAHTDPVVWAIGFRRDDGTFAAAVVNYAMHPVALGSSEERISPDWCGAAAHAVHATLPGKPITLITNGAAGNLNPPTVGVPPLEVARMGRAIGHAAANALKSSIDATNSPLRVKSISVPLPLDSLDTAGVHKTVHSTIASIQPGWEWETIFQYAVSAWGSEMTRQVEGGGGREASIEIQAIQLGDLNIVAINGELFSRFTQLVRQRSGRKLFVVGYANAAFGYIPSREAYEEGGYEVDQAHFFYNSFRPRKGSLELLADRAVELVNSM
jgi:hypothetical protein